MVKGKMCGERGFRETWKNDKSGIVLFIPSTKMKNSFYEMLCDTDNKISG